MGGGGEAEVRGENKIIGGKMDDRFCMYCSCLGRGGVSLQCLNEKLSQIIFPFNTNHSWPPTCCLDLGRGKAFVYIDCIKGVIPAKQKQKKNLMGREEGGGSKRWNLPFLQHCHCNCYKSVL